MKENLRQTKESSFYQYYNYVTRDDLLDIFGNDVVLTIKNFETKSLTDYIEDSVHNKSAGSVRFRSIWKSIDVRLVTNDGEAVEKASKKAIQGANGEDTAVGSKSMNHNEQNEDNPIATDQKRGPGRPSRNKKLTNDARQKSHDSKELDEDSDRRAAAKALLHFALKKKYGDEIRRDFLEGMLYHHLENFDSGINIHIHYSQVTTSIKPKYNELTLFATVRH